MIPAARLAAAIAVLDRVLAGMPAEKVLTGWGRRSRFAGSSDRAAVRDHVYDALRCRRSFAWLGGAETGRGLMLGAVRAAGGDPAEFFTGARFAPEPLGPQDLPGRPLEEAPEAVRLDCPDWVLPGLRAALGSDTAAVLGAMRQRAPVFLRVNTVKSDTATATSVLAEDGIAVAPHPLAATALQVTGHPRRVQTARAYREGLVELQDAASQAVCAALPAAARILDYCAGGGGKSLALSAKGARVFAHDKAPDRMRDLPERARRAGCEITVLATAELDGAAPFDLVLCDAPCSGSGTWRRTPDAKWRLTPQDLVEYARIQHDILCRASTLVAPGGLLAHVTCSLFAAENEARAAAFLAARPRFRAAGSGRLTPVDGGDGFYWALFRAPDASPAEV